MPSPATGGSGTQDAGVINIEDGGGSGDDEPAEKKQKKCTSGVWEYFDKYWVTVEVNGKKEQQHWAKCKFQGCKNKTSKGRCESRFGTTGFWTHLRYYHSIVKGQQQIKTENDEKNGVTIVKPFKYDQEESLKKFYMAMIVHEYPFNMAEHEFFQDWVKSLRPHYPLKSRVTVRKEVMDLCMLEKENMYEYFKTINCRFSATMDMWTSNQNKGYMCITLHWVDDDWKIQKRIANFLHVKGRIPVRSYQILSLHVF